MVLRNSEYKGNATFSSAMDLARNGISNNKYRADFLDLIKVLETNQYGANW